MRVHAEDLKARLERVEGHNQSQELEVSLTGILRHHRMVENAVYRYKAIIGPEMRTRTLARQRVEHRIGCEILNKITALGMPDTYCAG